MAREAFHSVPCLDKVPAKIECCECWGNRLLLGTVEGALLVYGVDLTDEEGVQQPQILKALKTFSKKPITQLCAVEQLNILVSLSGEAVSVHDLTTFDLRFTLAKSKGAVVFAVDLSETHGCRLAIASKKKVITLNWSRREFDERTAKEFAVSEVTTMIWAGNNLCVAMKKAYSILDCETGATNEILTCGRGPPLLTQLPEREMLVGKDQIGMILGYDGKPTRRFGVSWMDVPLATACSAPYVLAVLPKCVEVRTFHSQVQVQTLAIKSMKAICARGDTVYVAGVGSVVRLHALSLRLQIEELQGNHEYEEALALCGMLPESQSELRDGLSNDINTKYGFALFQESRYNEAMSHFLMAEFDLNQLLALYPKLLPESVRSMTLTPFQANLQGDELRKALEALVDFLFQKRKAQTLTSARVIDTALLKACFHVRPSAIQGILKSPNQCDVTECESLLMEKQRFADLVELYRSKSMHEEALKLLAKCATQEGDLRGPRPMIEYLQRLDNTHTKLVLDFSHGVLKNHPDEALAIFTSPRAKDRELPAKEVLAHLNGVAEQLAIPYLEFLVDKCGDKTMLTHNELALKYLKTVSILKSAEPAGTTQPAGSEFGRLGVVRRKLLDFLEKSNHYSPEQMLSHFPEKDLFEERAILLSRINQHEGALQIYAHDLGNFRMAEDYCARFYDADATDERKHIYLSLLRAYLQPTHGQPLLGPAFSLLNKHFTKIETSKALELLPADAPMSKLQGYFENVLRTTTRTRRQNQVKKYLLRAESLQVEESLIHAQGRRFLIKEETMCPVCNKRIGSSVFAAFPSGEVIHFHCKANFAESRAHSAE
eukprot:TRINITY_DN15092_c0_g1_i1.p1 TRINITY_DN15092_c0_g1~~TRINITY_DN15092_c0_g1_i1.p1  ORF type:complete len:831 (+),score=191.74 TRINITY_DN15092_c0_g1_i1:60-2552(+)